MEEHRILAAMERTLEREDPDLVQRFRLYPRSQQPETSVPVAPGTRRRLHPLATVRRWLGERVTPLFALCAAGVLLVGGLAAMIATTRPVVPPAAEVVLNQATSAAAAAGRSATWPVPVKLIGAMRQVSPDLHARTATTTAERVQGEVTVEAVSPNEELFGTFVRSVHRHPACIYELISRVPPSVDQYLTYYLETPSAGCRSLSPLPVASHWTRIFP